MSVAKFGEVCSVCSISTVYSVQCTMQRALLDVSSKTLQSVLSLQHWQCSVPCVQCAGLLCAVYNVQCTVYNVQCDNVQFGNVQCGNGQCGNVQCGNGQANLTGGNEADVRQIQKPAPQSLQNPMVAVTSFHI